MKFEKPLTNISSTAAPPVSVFVLFLRVKQENCAPANPSPGIATAHISRRRYFVTQCGKGERAERESEGERESERARESKRQGKKERL
jgi:hypothetical protein